MLRVKDVMTTPVVTVGSDSTVSVVAELLVTHGISAVPVVDGGKLVGIVSEGDLVHRAEIGTEPRYGRSWWLDLFTNHASMAAQYTKSHSVKVADVMTRNVVTVAEITPLAEVANVLDKKHIKRVPVMRSGEVVGIVSRANLVRALAMARACSPARSSYDNASIRTRLLQALNAEPWASIGHSNVIVSGGVVTFQGAIGSEEERKASQVLAENVEGVRRVDDHRAMIDFPIVAI